MTAIFEDRWQMRRGTAADLAAVNEVPLAEEVVYEIDKYRGKVGDGVTHYNDLLYSIVGRSDLTGLADGNVLVWNGATNRWEPGVGGGGSSVAPYTYSAPTFAEVSSLLHFEGADGSTVITDQVSGNVWTAHGTAALSTAWSAFGTSSLKVPSGSDSCISMPTNAGFNVGAGEWAIEFRFKYIGPPEGGARLLQTRNGDVNAGINLNWTGTNIALYLSSTGGSWDIANGVVLTPTLSKTDPLEIIVQRSGTVITTAINGSVVSTNFISAAALYYNAADTVVVGGQSTGTSRSINAYVDEFRFSRKAVIIQNRNYPDPGQFPDS